MNQITPLAVSITEAAKIIGISRTKLYQEFAAGRLKAKKVGRRTLIEVVEIHRYMSSLPQY